MTRWLALGLACLALGLAAAGCGGDDEDEGGGAAQTEQTETARTEAPGGASTVEVSMNDIQFDPREVTVPVGGTVKWTNNESAAHDVTKESGPGADFSSGRGNLKQGDTFEHKFDEPGTVEYVCTVHPTMTATVTVE